MATGAQRGSAVGIQPRTGEVWKFNQPLNQAESTMSA